MISNISAKCLYLPPFKGVHSHRIIQSFNGEYSHKKPLQYGVDFEMPEGTLVTASRAGKVIEVKMNSKLGGPHKRFLKDSNKIILAHSDGTHSLYAHLQTKSSRVSLGQKVEAGHPLARSGCTGWCDGPHLHFEVFKNSNKAKSGRESLYFELKKRLGCAIPKLGSQIKNEFTKRR